MLKNKNILFIAPKFFNYHSQIIIELEKMGATVYYFTEKKENIIYKILKNLTSNGLSLYNRLYEKFIEQKVSKKRIDYFFLIRGEHISNKFIENILLKNKTCISLYYQWDSFQNNPNGLNIFHFFHKCFSFDNVDCQKYNRFNYLPLFFTDGYYRLRDNPTQDIYDILFIGTIHGNRYDQLEEFMSFCIANNLKFKTYLYLPIILYLKQCLIQRKILRNINFQKLSEAEVLKLVSQSKVILDLPSPKQQGLTIRSIEALAANKKLISSSESMLNESFFSKEVILSFNDYNRTLEFMNCKSNIEISNFHSLNQWITKIFED